MSSNIRIEKMCLNCGREFIAKTTVTRYCSHQCNRRAYKSGVREKKIASAGIVQENLSKTRLEALNVKPFLSVREVCELIGIGRTMFYSLVKAGMLPLVKIGRRTVIERKNIDNLFNTLNYVNNIKKA